MYTDKQVHAIINDLTPITDRELEEAFDEALDDTRGKVKINGLEYPTSMALCLVDKTAYNCAFCDWLDAEIDAGHFSDEIQGKYYMQSEVDELLKSLDDDDE
jgi:hypothetical protein